MELDIGEVNEEFYNRILSAGPYGEGFEAPVFAAGNVSVVSDRKTQKNHHIMVLAGGDDARVPAVKWFGDDKSLQGKSFDIVYKVGRNTYRGNTQLQLTLDYMLEGNGLAHTAFTGRFIDARKLSIEEVLNEYEDVLVFYEGLKTRCPITDTVSRHGIERTKNLVFLSTPVNTHVFREVISLANPENVIINFTVIHDYSFKGFVTVLMGVLKGIVSRFGGSSSLEYLTEVLCVEENLLRAALKYVEALGKIRYLIDEEDGSILVSRGDNRPGKNIYLAQKNLKDALLEKNAYRQFILELKVDMFKEYLK